MGNCGCKNKNNQTQQPTTQGTNTTQTNQTPNNTIQESIKKVVEKYYKKK
jgi:hypothetical protein